MTLKLHHIQPDDPPDAFPPTDQALIQPSGLLATGGDLGPERLIYAYSQGIFPWFGKGESILWWTPDPRVVFTPGEVHISRRLERRLRQQDFAVTVDRAFEEVTRNCARPSRDEQDTWLIPEMRTAYLQLHKLGFAHSVEVWHQGQLSGGLYGVALGRAFFGESMFSSRPDMSKIALALLSAQLHEWDYLFLDGQVGSAHLYLMGAFDMPRPEFEKLLKRAVPAAPQPTNWAVTSLFPAPVEHLPAHLVDGLHAQ